MTPALALGLLLLLSAGGAASSPPPAPAATPLHTYWIQSQPDGVEEKELHDAALAASGFSSADATARAFTRVSDAYPGTVTSGLAQLAAGLALADDGRTAAALPYLRHVDVARTAVADYAALTIARLQEEQDPRAGAETYDALLNAFPESPLTCTALLAGAEAFEKAALPARAQPLAERALAACAGSEPRALLVIARSQEVSRDAAGAAATYDRLGHDYPLSAESDEAERKLRTLAPNLRPDMLGVQGARDLKKALTLFDAGKFATAAPLLRKLLLRRDLHDQFDLVRLRLGRCLIETKRWREAETHLRAVPAASPLAAEAAFFLARLDAHFHDRVTAYEDVAVRFKGSPWGEEALLSVGTFHMKDALLAEALPYFHRILTEYPEGKYGERASWWVGLGEFRAGHFESAATVLEGAARRFSATSLTPGFLFWAGLARIGQGETERGRALLEEDVRRYKHAYHGRRAAETLARLPPSTTAPLPALRSASQPDPSADVPAANLARVRQLLLIERLDDTLDELKRQPATSATQATVAWIHWRRGRLRLAINTMKRAYPEYIGEAGDRLPPEVLKILYPIQFRTELETKARARSLDPALVAALICQESTFDPGARSSAGARGLMQIIPVTGRLLARTLGVRFRAQSLHNPEVSLEFGTRYLRDMVDRFGGHVERALAAYNAGPHRVDAWTASRPDVPAEEFVETIPFTETRGYVTSILAMTERYRVIYSLGGPQPPAGK